MSVKVSLTISVTHGTYCGRLTEQQVWKANQAIMEFGCGLFVVDGERETEGGWYGNFTGYCSGGSAMILSQDIDSGELQRQLTNIIREVVGVDPEKVSLELQIED